MRTLVRRLGGSVLCVLVLVVVTACTGPTEHHAAKPSSSPSPSASVGSGATLTPKPLPLTVRVTRVSGKLGPKLRRSLEHNVGKTVRSYFNAAFLAGPYPRKDFSSAFSAFTKSAAHEARKDRRLLTNVHLGPTIQSVTPKIEGAYLSVLAPYKVAAGLSAHIHLEFVANRGDKPARRVIVKGRLSLTHGKSGKWQIIAYHVSRSSHVVGAEGSGT
ncbi:MAG TPA: hypothetical protein VFJ19_13750 [Nocardioidaceae bacterium]|nr:hypothetical protein [Nocardioidaceae bacterium]